MKYNKIFAAIIVVIALVVGALILFLQENKPVVVVDDDNNTPPANKTVIVFFGNTQKNPNAIDCGAVFPVERTVPANSGYDELLGQLFAGPTAQETSLGYASFFSAQTADILLGVKTDSDTAYVNLKDVRTLIPNASASCGSAEFFGEIFETLGQDGRIKKIFFAIDGDPAPFYEWLQIGCDPETNNCDPTPFK